MGRARKMKATLKPGLTQRLLYKVPENKTVPHLFPEAPLFRAMPDVFATGYMVGLFEWVCTDLVARHLDEGEGSVGVHVDFTHKAATPPGMTITVEAECIAVDGLCVKFRVTGHDGIDEIGGGLHERRVIKRERFDARVAEKKQRALAGAT